MKKKNKKLSGAQYKNLRRARALKDSKVRAVVADVMRMPYIGRLKTLNDWRLQVARLYRRAAKGVLPPELATKLTYIANVGATLAKEAQEQKELELLRQQLLQLQGRAPAAGLLKHNGGAVIEQGEDL
jgi:hypothetical protein